MGDSRPTARPLVTTAARPGISPATWASHLLAPFLEDRNAPPSRVAASRVWRPRPKLPRPHAETPAELKPGWKRGLVRSAAGGEDVREIAVGLVAHDR